MTDDELKALHGDHPIYSIQQWRHQRKLRLTKLEYIDWRADKMYADAEYRKAS